MLKNSFSWFAVRQVAIWGIAAALAFGLYSLVSDLTVCWRLTSLPGVPPAYCEGGTDKPLREFTFVEPRTPAESTATPEPLPFSEDILYPSWDGASRINILFVGLRGGESTEPGCPYCTDTLILLTVDPTTKTAGMLSIPRDLWVNIPGFGYSRINTAWTLGRGSRLPGGGPALTMKTVSHFVGVPVDYYVQVDFDTFVDVIDLLGGVDIHNDENLFLDPVYQGREYPKVKLTCCGMRHLSGRVALAYARCRHIEQGCTGGDISRARRQQKVIFAIREKVLDPANFPNLLVQARPLYNAFSGGIHTNMSLDDAIRLAVLARDIPKNKIQNGVIDDTMVVGDSVMLGGVKASIIRPIQDRVRVLRDQIFTTSGPVSPLASGDLLALMQADNASIRILNGTSSPDLDTRTGIYLSQQGVRVTEFGTTKTYQGQTQILLYSPKLYTLKFIMAAFSITRSTQILIKPDPTQTVDIEIRLGADWTGRLPADP